MHLPGNDLPSSARIGIRELRAELATFVRQAGAGDRILISVDGRPVAQLGPIQPDGEPTLHDLAAAGLVRLPGRDDHPSEPPATSVPVDALPDHVMAELRGHQPSRTTRR